MGPETAASNPCFAFRTSPRCILPIFTTTIIRSTITLYSMATQAKAPRQIELQSPMVIRLRPYVGFDLVEVVQSKLFLRVFAIIGVIYIVVKLLSFLRLLVSLFMMPGKSVSIPKPFASVSALQ